MTLLEAIQLARQGKYVSHPAWEGYTFTCGDHGRLVDAATGKWFGEFDAIEKDAYDSCWYEVISLIVTAWAVARISNPNDLQVCESEYKAYAMQSLHPGSVVVKLTGQVFVPKDGETK